MRNVRQCNKGFSLLEVMIALAIVAIALVTLLGLSNRSIMVHATIQKLTRATMLAQQVMNDQELNAAKTQLTWETQTEKFTEPFADFSWQVSYQDTLIRQVKQVTVVVSWGEEANNEQVQLVSFLPIKGG